jgi:membrane associated rhomboid family serine protease
MGIYDRDYYREERSGLSLRGPRTAVGALILINVALYLVDALFFHERHQLTNFLAASEETLSHPTLWWQLVTYGFVHSPAPFHVLFNMLQLWFLGREVEFRYGRMEFLRLYLAMIAVGSLIWTVTAIVARGQLGLAEGQGFRLLGASGAVSGVVLLFVLNFPQRTLILFPIPIPVKAWVIGVLLVVSNVFGQVSQMGDTAYLVHLAGLAFAFLYFHFGWNFGRLVPGRLRLDWLKPQPSLRVHDPDQDPGSPQAPEPDLGDEVDRILAKIHQQGEASLTRKERRILQNASRQYQKRRQESSNRDL